MWNLYLCVLQKHMVLASIFIFVRPDVLQHKGAEAFGITTQ
jgi:hypothetical protein